MSQPDSELLQIRARAKAALKRRLPTHSSRRRNLWLAEKMGIEPWFAIVADMDAVECETVIAICSVERTDAEKKSAEV